MDKVPLLSLAIFLPAVAAAALAFVRDARVVKWVAAAATALVFGALLMLAAMRASARPEGRFVEETCVAWIPAIGANYHVGADGISLSLGVLTALLTLLSVLCSWETIKERPRGFFLTLLVLETGMLGVFFALDLFLFYVFWEVALIPMYFLIGVWGGPRRVYAAMKFVLYTVAGSLLMLVAAIYVYRMTGTFEIAAIPRALAERAGDPAAQGAYQWAFLAFALAFAIKVPMLPFHTWLPDAHVEAPTAGSVILAGVLLKMGVYGFVRIAIPFFPDEAAGLAPAFLVVAAAGGVYGAFMAMAQTDIKKLIAYSSVSHMGFVILGVFGGLLTADRTAAQGAILQSINHGISTGGLFLLVGMIYERSHVRGVEDFGGLAKVTPKYAAVFLVVTLSSIGLPGTNGFVGEFLILLGTFVPGGTLERACAAATATAVILGAVYMLGLYRRVFFGVGRTKRWDGLADLTALEWATLAPLIVLIFAIGVQPSWLLKLTEPAWAYVPPLISK